MPRAMASATVRRVAVLHQGFIPVYRSRFYELLSRQSDVEYVVFHGDPPTGSAHRVAKGPFSFPEVRVESRELRVAGRWAIYQPVVRRIATGGFAGLVPGEEAKFLSNHLLFALFRAWGRAIVVWGSAFEKEQDLSRAGAAVASVSTRLKGALARSVAGYLAYTEGGRERLVAAGLDPSRVAVVRNTLDMEEQQRLHESLRSADEPSLRRRLALAPDSVVLLYVGRIYAEKRIEQLVELVERLRADRPQRPPVEAVVVGDGPALGDVRERAAGVDGIRFEGAVYDQARVAEWLRVAAAVVIPGKVGLAVNHAFAHGVPVLTRQSRLHAPEVEYIEPGVSGLVVEGDFERFVEAVREIVESPERRSALAAGALRGREDLGLAAMARAFDAGVRRALDQSSSRVLAAAGAS